MVSKWEIVLLVVIIVQQDNCIPDQERITNNINSNGGNCLKNAMLKESSLTREKKNKSDQSDL